jgi:hypothetical protein
MIPWQKKPYRRSECPYDKCPYHQLDGFKTYTDYLKSIGADNITKLLMTAGLKRLGQAKTKDL